MQRQKRTGEERGGAGTGCGSEQEAGPVQGLEGQVAWMRTPVLLAQCVESGSHLHVSSRVGSWPPRRVAVGSIQ